MGVPYVNPAVNYNKHTFSFMSKMWRKHIFGDIYFDILPWSGSIYFGEPRSEYDVSEHESEEICF